MLGSIPLSTYFLFIYQLCISAKKTHALVLLPHQGKLLTPPFQRRAGLLILATRMFSSVIRALPCPLPYLALQAKGDDEVSFAFPATASAGGRTSSHGGTQRIRYSARCRIVTVVQHGVIQRNKSYCSMFRVFSDTG